jgi:hypothetical protein
MDDGRRGDSLTSAPPPPRMVGGIKIEKKGKITKNNNKN